MFWLLPFRTRDAGCFREVRCLPITVTIFHCTIRTTECIYPQSPGPAPAQIARVHWVCVWGGGGGGRQLSPLTICIAPLAPFILKGVEEL